MFSFCWFHPIGIFIEKAREVELKPPLLLVQANIKTPFSKSWFGKRVFGLVQDPPHVKTTIGHGAAFGAVVVVTVATAGGYMYCSSSEIGCQARARARVCTVCCDAWICQCGVCVCGVRGECGVCVVMCICQCGVCVCARLCVRACASHLSMSAGFALSTSSRMCLTSTSPV